MCGGWGGRGRGVVNVTGCQCGLVEEVVAAAQEVGKNE